MKSRETFSQETPYDSPWTVRQRIGILSWEYVWYLFCAWTPKPLNFWRIWILRGFGARIHGRPFVHQRARIQIPWNLTLHDRACLGDGANAYSLGEIEIHEHATVAQEAYLCTGSHAFNKRSMNLITAKITLEAHAFIGARAFIMPGLTIGREAVVGAMSVVTKNVAANAIVAGNPARQIGVRNFGNA
jgi:putative colanic acid biosynthesis acetyltransferase WcaF